jgi:6-phosphogluconolactonase
MPTLYVGTYTRKEGHVDGHAKGIHAYSFDEASGALKLLQVTEGAGINPSYVFGSTSTSTLYAVNESNEPSSLHPGQETGFVSAYRMGKDGELTQLSRHETGGAFTCHVALSPNGDFVSVANYGGGSLSIDPVQADGSLGAACDHHRFEGASLVIPDRQEASHIHSTAWTPTGLVAADLGNDRVVQYTLDVANKKLVNEQFIVAAPGSGPRHFALSPELGVGYVVNELDNTVTVHPLDAKTGKLGAEVLQNISTLPKDYSGPAALASDVHVSSNGKFVYAATRFYHSIACYKILPDKRLELVEIIPTRGDTPRDILVYKDFVVALNQDTSSLDVFRADPNTGKLTYTGNSVECPSPSSMFIAQ